MTKSWPLAPLGEVLTPVERAEVPKPGTVYRQIGVRLWGVGAYEREPLDGAATKYTTLFRAETGDVIVNKIWARNGSVAVVPGALAGCYGSGEFPMFSPQLDRLDPFWMHWLTKTPTFWAQCDEKSQGTSGQNRIRPERFLDIHIPLPPLAEQRRVVARLDELVRQIEKARTLRHQAAVETDALERQAAESTFERLATNGVRTVPFEAACADITVGQVSSMRHAYREEGVPFLRSQNVRKNRFESKGLAFIAPEFHASNRKSALKPGDVVIVRTGFVGVACVVPESLPEANCADLVIVRPGPRLDPHYAALFLNSPSGRERAVSASVGSAQRHYNVGAMRKTTFPLPSLPDQCRIVDELDRLQAEVEAMKRLQAATSAELDATLAAILDRGFKGGL